MGVIEPSLMSDSHVHLDRYTADAVRRMLARARRAGVRRFLTVGVDEISSEAAVTLATRYRGVLAAVGVHPRRVAEHDLPHTLGRLRELARSRAVAAIGEIGLDGPAEHSVTAVQESFFRGLLELAAELALPAVLHIVGEHDRAQGILAERQPRRAVVHYFRGDIALAEAYLALGCFISLGKRVTRPDERDLREAVKWIPLDRLLLETDTYPLPGRKTETRDVADVCRAVAELRGIPWEVVARATTANYRQLFTEKNVVADTG